MEEKLTKEQVEIALNYNKSILTQYEQEKRGLENKIKKVKNEIEFLENYDDKQIKMF